MTDRDEESGKEFLEFLGYSESTVSRNNESTSSNVDLEASATSSSSRRDRRPSRSNSRPSQGSSSRIGGGSMSKLKKTRSAGTRSSSPGPPLTRLSGTSGSGSSSKRSSSPMLRTTSYSPTTMSMTASNFVDETQAQQEYRRRRQQSATSSSSGGNHTPHRKRAGKSPTRRATSAAPASTSSLSSPPKSGNLGGSSLATGSGYVTSTSTTTTPPRRARNRMPTTRTNSPPTPPTSNTATAVDIDQSDHSIHVEGDRFVSRRGQDNNGSEEFHDEIPARKTSKSMESSKSMGSRSMSGGGGSSRRRYEDDEEEGMNEDIQYLNTMISGYTVKNKDHHSSDSAIPPGRRGDGLRRASILDNMRNLYSSSFPARSTSTTTAGQQPEKMPGSTTSQAGLLNASRSSLDAFEIMKSVGAASLGNVELDTSERTNTPRYSTTTPTTNKRGSFGIANRYSWSKDSNKSVKKGTKQCRWLTIVCSVLAVALLVTIGTLLAIYGQDLFSKNASPANGNSGGSVISESDAGHAQETLAPTTPAPVIAADAPTTAAPQEVAKTLDFSKVPQTSRHDALEFWILDQGLSNPADLSSTSTEPSAASRALFWLIEDDPTNLTIPGFGTTRRKLAPADQKEAEVMLRVLLQRYALMVFYISQEEGIAVADKEAESSGTATDDTSSSEQERRNRLQMDTHWATALPTCEWPGVTCNEDKMVVALNLTSYLLKGTIPPEIFAGGALPALTSLDLSHNRLHGNLPVTFVANSGESATGLDPIPLPLQELRLNDNQIQGGLEGLQGLGQLALLDLSDNNLGGSIPAAIKEFPKLSSLMLDFNHLDGTLPTDLGKLTALETLSMEGNQLSGPIPNAWWTLSHLKILDLGHNEGINGIIPNFLGTKVKDLRVIDFRETNLEGSIPDILEHLTNLEAMYLHRTNLVGHMPDGVCVLRAPLGHLKELTSDCVSAKEGGTVKCICCTECFW